MMKPTLWRRAGATVLTIALALAAFSVESGAKSGSVELPKIENATIAPRILYLNNPRFPDVTDAELKTVVRRAARLVKDHFGITVRLPDHIPARHIDRVFEPLLAQAPRWLKRQIGDFRGGKVDWGRVRKELVEQIEKQTDPLEKQIAFAEPYLTSPVKWPSKAAFAKAVVETFKTRLAHWTVAKLADGHPVIGRVPGRPDLPLNEYGYWTFLMRQGIDAEIILTNQLVASVEYFAVPVHSSIRGGITGGSTEFNPKSRLGASVWVSLFPYLSGDAEIRKLRNGDDYARDDALTYAAAMLAHEMGHQLLHLGHPWSNPACIMRPAEVLDFARWTARFDAASCAVGSSKAMTPGVLKIPVW